ncbi:MAG: arginase [Planctomycetales bacterium]|nr:arginase [Planctomycetales bacterium]
MRISIIGVPMDLGAGRRGVDMGPSAIRIAGLHDRLRALGHEVRDLGDVDCAIPETRQVRDPKLRFLDEIVESCEALAKVVEKAVREGSFPVVLGGDHSIAMGTLAGIARVEPRIGIVYLDAHADFNTAETSPSGNIHGMPLAAALGYGDPRLTKIGGVAPKALEESVVLVGIRDLDPGEQDLLRSSKATYFTLRDIDEMGMAEVMRRAIAIATRGTAKLHVTFDMDVLDPRFAPGTGTPVEGGITIREAHLAMEMLHDSRSITSLEITECNPILDNGNRTGELATLLIASALGKRIV